MKSDNIIHSKAIGFAIRIVNLYKYLSDSKKEYVMSKQLLRSGTSIGANISEATQGMTTKDFTHSMAIALKEAQETNYWLEILVSTDYLSREEYESILSYNLEIIKLLTAILKTSRNL